MTPEEMNLLDPDEDETGGQREPGQLPELPAPKPHLSGDEPVSVPLILAELDPNSAKEALRAPFETAASLYPEIDSEETYGLVSATIDRVCTRKALKSREAISASELAAVAGIEEDAEARLAPPLPEFGQVVGRVTFAQAGSRVFYEQYESHPSAAGRRHNGEGTEKVRGVGDKRLMMLEHTAAGSGRLCTLEGIPLNKGTRWARSCDRYGDDFPRWAREREEAWARRREEFPDEFAEPPFRDEFVEHVRALLAPDRRVRSRVVRGLTENSVALSGTITPKSLLGAISKYLMIGPIRYGTSLVPYRTYHDVFFPGDDPATVEEVTAGRRSVALACKPPTPEDLLAFREESEPLEVGKLPSMYELDIRRMPGVRYRWSPSRHVLVRYSAGEGARVDVWRLTGVEKEEDFWRMVATIERYAQVTWTKECLDRYDADCMPGRLQVHLPEQCAGMRALLAMANSGMVDALRAAD